MKIKVFFLLLLTAVTACKKESEGAAVETNEAPATESTTDGNQTAASDTIAESKTYIILNKEKSEYFDAKYSKDVEDAFVIANAILKSYEFQKAFNGISFPYWNYCKSGQCKPEKDKPGQFVMGSAVYQRMSENMDFLWTVYLEKKSRSSLGATCPGTDYTTAYFENIKGDMRKLPHSYAIAVNLCHEYMHHIGFCHKSNSFNEPDDEHPDPLGYKNDIAYRCGWVAYFIAKNWYDNKVTIAGI